LTTGPPGEWFDYALQGVQNRFPGKRVRLFVMGDDVWRDEDEFPLARARETRFYLGSGGGRATGVLTEKAPRKSAPSEYYVSSSNYPRFDPNRNAGEPIADPTGGVVARQTIYHDAARPSALVVPVVPR
jgi:predicted acyl esterase